MANLGAYLREARDAKAISPEQVEADTKIKVCFIEALEAENFEVFPSAPMLRGFLKNYSDYLKLDMQEVLSLFEADASVPSRLKIKQVKHINPFMALPMIRRRRSLLSIDAFITLLIIWALLGSAAFFVYTQYLEPAQANGLESVPQLQWLFPTAAPAQAETIAPAATDSAAAIVLPTPSPLPTDTPTPTPTPSPQYYTGVAVELVVHERSWVQILADDQKIFEGTLEAGETPNWVGEKRVAIRAGNGGGIEVFVNGQSMGLMGEAGQVIDQVWEKVDEIPDAPTETPSPDAEITPTPEN